MKIHDFPQNSPEWYQARLGIPTASGFSRIITPMGAPSKSADDYANELCAELIAGEPIETFEGSSWTRRGKELEPEAIAMYEQTTGRTVTKVGFITNDAHTMGCSPDGLVDDDGDLEIKIPAPKNHVGYLLGAKLDREHYPQTMGRLLITGRKWCDIMSFHPLMKPKIIRIERDEPYLFEMSKQLGIFNKTMAEKKAILIETGYLKG